MFSEDFFLENLALAIQEHLKKNNLTVQQFSRSIEEPQKDIAHILHNSRCNPRLKTLVAVCNGMDIEIRDIPDYAGRVLFLAKAVCSWVDSPAFPKEQAPLEVQAFLEESETLNRHAQFLIKYWENSFQPLH